MEGNGRFLREVEGRGKKGGFGNVDNNGLSTQIESCFDMI